MYQANPAKIGWRNNEILGVNVLNMPNDTTNKEGTVLFKTFRVGISSLRNPIFVDFFNMFYW